MRLLSLFVQTAVSADYLKLKIQELFTGQFEINKHKTDISFISLLQRVQEYKSQNQIKSLQPGKVVGLLVIVFFFCCWRLIVSVYSN